MDKTLDAQFANRVSVHSYAGENNHIAEFSFLLGTLGKGDRLAHFVTGVVMRVLDLSSDSGFATVSVCRAAPETQESCAAGADADCDGMVGGADQDCWSFVPRPPNPSPPPSLPPASPPLPAMPAVVGGGTIALTKPRMPPPPPRRPIGVPAGAFKTCQLGHAFCSDVAKFAKQVGTQLDDE